MQFSSLLLRSIVRGELGHICVVDAGSKTAVPVNNDTLLCL